MGQLPSSAFQAYDPSNASSIQPGPFALYSVSVNQILLTQMNEGFAEVDAKISGWNLVSPSNLQSTLLTDIEPVVIGPDGKVYLLNGHHTYTSLVESNYGASNPTVYVNVVANYSNLTVSEFWTQMQAANLVLPLNEGVPQTLNTNTGAPIPTSLTGLTNDPYRGLERSILKNKSSVLFAGGATTPGLDKINGFYSDFIWAEAYRNANGGLGLSYLSPSDIAQSTQWNLNGASATTMPNISGTVTVAQLPGFILGQDITISTTINNATLANGTLDGNGTFTGHTSFTFGSITLGTVQSGFVMQLGADLGHTVNVGATALLALTGGTKGETVTFTNGVTRTGNATLFIDPSSTTSLGTTGFVKAGTVPTITNGIVSAWLVTDNAGGASSNPYDFLTYTANGYVKATYSQKGSGSSGGIRVASATDTVEQTGNTTLAANAQAYALKVDSGATITATGFTIRLGDGTNPAGLILSNGIISGGTLAFGSSEALIYAKGNSVAISSTITGSNGLTLSGSGTLALSAASTLTGLISIDSGTLSLTAANVFANDTSGLTLLNVKSSPSASILNFTANQTFTTLNSDGNNSSITFSNSAKLTIGDSINNLDSTLSSAITETGAAVTGALTKAGAGLLDLSAISKGKLTLLAGSSIAVTGGTLRLVQQAGRC